MATAAASGNRKGEQRGEDKQPAWQSGIHAAVKAPRSLQIPAVVWDGQRSKGGRAISSPQNKTPRPFGRGVRLKRDY
jgi:hypothetical protein